MRDSAHGATELAEAPPLIRPVLTVAHAPESKKVSIASVLCAIQGWPKPRPHNSARAWDALPCTFRNIWPEPLRDTVTSPPGPPGSELMAARAPRARPAPGSGKPRGSQLLIGREHEGHGAIDQAEPLQGPRREQVGHKPRLHVGHAGPGGPIALYLEGPRLRRTLGENRIPYARGTRSPAPLRARASWP